MRNLFFLLLTAAALLAIPGYSQTEKPWQQLFNGKDLTGWKHVGPGNMTVENGLIQTHGGMGLLYWTAGKLGNCRIRVVFKMRDHNDNSGVYIRIPIEPREPWMPVHYGYEVQIDNQPDGMCLDQHGNLYIAHNGMRLVEVLSRKGRLIRQFPAGALTVSDVAFGGPKMDQLFITGGLGATGHSEGVLFRFDLRSQKGLPMLSKRQ